MVADIRFRKLRENVNRHSTEAYIRHHLLHKSARKLLLFALYIYIFSCLKHLALQHTFLESSNTIVDIIHKVVAMCYNYVAMS